jgi:hypothetical protein
MPRCRDETGADVPYPVTVVDLHEDPSRRGYGPRDRRFTPVETLSFAAMRQLLLDDDLGQRYRALAASRPPCGSLDIGVPVRFIVSHAQAGRCHEPGCRRWVAVLVELARDTGCPDLWLIHEQVETAGLGLPPGQAMRTRLRPPPGPRPKRPTGIRDRPAIGLLARRAYRVGSLAILRASIAVARRDQGIESGVVDRQPLETGRRGWPRLVLEMEVEIVAWEAGWVPPAADITFPAWEEWQRNPRRRRGRDRVVVEDSIRLAASDLGQSYRKAASRIELTVGVGLPSLPLG